MAAVLFIMLLAGCSSMEVPGITKPQPNIKWANVFRSSSSAAVQTNRVEFWMTQFACYRTVGTTKIYLQFQYVRAEATGGGGRGIYILSSGNDEALQQNYTYYILVGIGAYVYDNSAAMTRSSAEALAAEQIARTRKGVYGRELTESEMDKVRKLAGLIVDEQNRRVFTPIHIDPQSEATRSSSPTTDAYDAGLWECLPDGTSKQIL